MGQYYKPTNLSKREWLYSHDYKSEITNCAGEKFECGQGLKLMEHSYIGNPMMNAIEQLLMPSGRWYKDKIVWAGDYADKENGKTDENDNLYTLIGVDENKVSEPNCDKIVIPKEYKYILNWDKKQFIDKSKLKKDENGYIIHPLPLLTCEGNGRGGGDFRNEGEDFFDRIGSWSRYRIAIENNVPSGFTEISGYFREDR